VPARSAGGRDLLYQLCIEVNPELDIHTVRLPDGPDRESRERAPASEARPAERLAELARSVRGIERRLAQAHRRAAGGRAHGRTRRERAAAGLADDGKPLASFLFLGRTGTGKTELARVLARELFGSLEHLVRVDCSEYGLGHEYSKLIGAPPGYVGHEHGGFLTEAVRKDPTASCSSTRSRRPTRACTTCCCSCSTTGT
jgi:transcriptional regulator of acetoin/glycerol metabolism